MSKLETDSGGESKAREILGEGERLFSDCFSEWSFLYQWAASLLHGKEYPIQASRPKHYADYCESLKTKFGKDLPTLIMQESDPAAIAEFDSLVDEFNQRYDGIVTAKNAQVAMGFVDRVKRLIRAT